MIKMLDLLEMVLCAHLDFCVDVVVYILGLRLWGFLRLFCVAFVSSKLLQSEVEIHRPSSWYMRRVFGCFLKRTIWLLHAILHISALLHFDDLLVVNIKLWFFEYAWCNIFRGSLIVESLRDVHVFQVRLGLVHAVELVKGSFHRRIVLRYLLRLHWRCVGNRHCLLFWRGLPPLLGWRRIKYFLALHSSSLGWRVPNRPSPLMGNINFDALLLDEFLADSQKAFILTVSLE